MSGTCFSHAGFVFVKDVNKARRTKLKCVASSLCLTLLLFNGVKYL